MADDRMKLGITLDVDSTGTELIDALQRKVNALAKSMAAITANMRKAAQAVSLPGRSATSNTDSKAEVRSARDLLALDRASVAEFRRKLTLKTRMAAQHAREERDALKAYKDRVAFQSRATAQAEKEEARSVQNRMKDEAQAFRQRFAFGTRMGRQAVQEEKARAREQERSIASAARAESQRMRERAAELRDGQRREIAETRRHEREIARHESQRSRGYADLRSGASDVRQGLSRATTGAAVISGAGVAGAGAAARRGISTRLEVDSAETNLKIFSGQTQAQIKAARRGFLDNEAIKNGLGIAGGLNTYNEVLKAGIKSPELNTKTIMQAVSALELDLASTTKLAGLLDRNFGASSTPAKLKSALNAVAISAREDPTNAGEIVEGVKRGFGALSTGNMTPEQLTALVSGVQSVGVQPGKAGTYIATLGKQLSMGSSKFLDPKNRKELNFAAKELGFGDARQMAKTYTNDSYNTIVKLNERLNAMEAGKRTNVAEALMGRQWSDETLQNAQGVEGQKKTYSEIMSPGSANFLEEAARQRAESLQGQWSSTKSVFNRFWDSFGAGFEDILTSINRYFLDLNSSFDYDKVKSYVVSFFDGVKDALGVKTWQDLLQNVFGGNLGNYGQQIRDFGKGLTEGIMGFVRGVRSVFEVFAGSNASAETIGKFVGQFIALSAALIVCSPAIALLNGIGLAIAGIASVALGAWRILKAAGLIGATGLGASPKVPEVPGKGISRLGSRLGAAGAAAGFAGTSSLSKGEQDALSKRLGSWAQDREKSVAPSTPWIDPPARNAINTLKEAVEENTLLHRQSFERESGLKGLIHKAALSSSDSPAQGVKSSIEALGSRVQSAALSGATALGGGLSGGSGPLGNSIPGSALGGGSGLSRRGILGGGGGGGGAASGPIRDRMKSVYDAYRSAGLSHESAKSFAAEIGRENDFNPKLMFGSHIDPHNGKRNAGMMSWQGDRATKLLETLRAGGHLNSDGSIKQTQESLNAQAKFSLDEMKNGALGAKGQRALGVLQNPNASHADRALALGDDVIKWRQHDPRYASHANKRDNYYNQMEGVSKGSFGGGSSVGSAVAANVADNASKMIGMGSSQAASALGSKMTPGQWCADFVNGSLKSAGIKGVNSSIANSFLGWGKEVTDGIKKGDVLVESRGRGIGQPGGHAGIATGNSRQGPRGLQYETISGNHGNQVGKGWTDASKLTGRRAITGGMEDTAATIRSSGWKKPEATGSAPNSFGGSADAMTRDAPVRQQNLLSPGKGGGIGGGGNTSNSNVSINVNGANQDTESLANAIQRKVKENTNRSTYDADFASI